MSATIPKLKIVCKPIPGAASTQVKLLLASIDPDMRILVDQLARQPISVHAIYDTTRFLPRAWQHYAAWWRFTVVRDPVERLLAFYSERILRGQLLRRIRGLSGQTKLPLMPTPDEFILHLPTYMEWSNEIKAHALPVSHFISNQHPLPFANVYKTTELAQMAADLSEYVGETVELPPLKGTPSQVTFDDLAPETQARLLDFLAADYQLLSAYFTPPQAKSLHPPQAAPAPLAPKVPDEALDLSHYRSLPAAQ